MSVDTTFVSALEIPGYRSRTCTCTFARDSDVLGIAAEARNVALDPFDGYKLVAQPVVGGVAGIAQFLRRQKSKHTQAITVGEETSAPSFRRIDLGVLDVYSDHWCVSLKGPLYEGCKIVLRPCV